MVRKYSELSNIQIINLLRKLAVITIFISFYFSFLVEGTMGITSTRNIFLLLTLILFSLQFIFSNSVKIQIDKSFFSYLLIGILIGGISMGFWFSLKGLNVYFTLITCSIVIINDFEFFKKGIKYLFYLIFILALYEFLFKNYIFYVYRETEWGLKALDSVFFGGASGIFRAKSLFEGPLALSQFAMGMALLFRDNLKIIIIAILLTVLANGRLGMLVTSSIFGLYLLKKYGGNIKISSKTVFIGFGILLALIISLIYFMDEKSLERLQKVFNLGEASNSARVYYWINAVEVFFNYDFFNLLFGNSGYFRYAIGNSAENGWLMLLVDNGIIGFSFYLFPLITIFWMSIKKRGVDFIYIMLLFLCCFVQTFNLGVSASLFFWLIIYSLYTEVKKKNYEKAL